MKVQTWDSRIFHMSLCSTLAYPFITGLVVPLLAGTNNTLQSLFHFLLTSHLYYSVTDINVLSSSVLFLLLPHSNFSAYTGYVTAQNILLRVLFMFSLGRDASEARWLLSTGIYYPQILGWPIGLKEFSDMSSPLIFSDKTPIFLLIGLWPLSASMAS